MDDSPLGILDVASLSKDEYMSMKIHFPGRIGYNYTLPPDNHKSHRCGSGGFVRDVCVRCQSCSYTLEPTMPVAFLALLTMPCWWIQPGRLLFNLCSSSTCCLCTCNGQHDGCEFWEVSTIAVSECGLTLWPPAKEINIPEG